MGVSQTAVYFFTNSVKKFIKAIVVCCIFSFLVLHSSIANNLDDITNETLGAQIIKAENQVVSLFSVALHKNAEFRRGNLTAYLSLYTLVVGSILAAIFAVVSYRLSDQMSPYRLVRNKTSMLTAASGLGLGIFIAAIEVPSSHPARLTLLLITVSTGVLVMWSVTWLGFAFLRSRSLRQARLEGRPYSERLRQG